MKEQINITLATNGLLLECPHETLVYHPSPEKIKEMLEFLASYFRGYYSSDYGTKEIRISVEEANLDYIGETEGI